MTYITQCSVEIETIEDKNDLKDCWYELKLSREMRAYTGCIPDKNICLQFKGNEIKVNYDDLAHAIKKLS